jgi:hypothetical protein
VTSKITFLTALLVISLAKKQLLEEELTIIALLCKTKTYFHQFSNQIIKLRKRRQWEVSSAAFHNKTAILHIKLVTKCLTTFKIKTDSMGLIVL